MNAILKLSLTSVAVAAFAVVALLPVSALAAGREAGAAETASPRTCTQEDAQRSDQEASSLSTWGDLHASYARYRQCDDGAIGEGYSSSVAALLADHWDTLPALGRLVNQYPSFERFVLRHVDELMTMEQAEAIDAHVSKGCSKDLSGLCAAIKKRMAEGSRRGER
jgi:hypothetical protein